MCIETLQVKGFPSFKLFKAGDNEEVDYTGPRTIQGFVEFLSPEVDMKKTTKYEL